MSAPRDLLDMLTYRRPSGSVSEVAFIKRFLLPLGVKPDKAGNLILRIGDAPVLWSSHTDTVHNRPGRQNVRLDGHTVRLARKSEASSCLGADDAAGCWLMSEMIRAGTEGLYVFHAAEEIGGIGSTHIARETPELLDGISMAIALDRKGKDSVITHQAGRCCSDTFADALGEALGLGMRPDPTGLFTDTANYTEIIPECTNLSVGYEAAHSAKESLDIAFLVTLRDQLLRLDCTTLPVTRDPKEDASSWLRLDGGWDSWGDPANDIDAEDYYRLLRMVEDEPEVVAAMLQHYGITSRDVRQWQN